MFDRITLDKETFKVLAADTRVDILKKLADHKATLTDISQEFGMSASTIKEHLDRLLSADLIEQAEGDTKWKYYNLTKKGSRIVNPSESNVWIVLSTSAVVLGGSIFSLMQKMRIAPLAGKPMMAEMEVKVATPVVAEAARDFATNMVHATPIPYLEIILIILSAAILGAMIGSIFRK